MASAATNWKPVPGHAIPLRIRLKSRPPFSVQVIGAGKKNEPYLLPGISQSGFKTPRTARKYIAALKARGLHLGRRIEIRDAMGGWRPNLKNWRPVSYGLKWRAVNRKGIPTQREKFFQSKEARTAFLSARRNEAGYRGGAQIYNGIGSPDSTVVVTNNNRRKMR